MTRPVMTEAEMFALVDRTQDYINRLHEFAQAEALKADIPPRIAVPAVIGWAIGIAREAGINITSIGQNVVDGADKPRFH
jgi:hypothetical protein